MSSEETETLFSFWKSRLDSAVQHHPKTYRFGVTIQHCNHLVQPHPYLETNHTPLEILVNLFEFRRLSP